jgi:NADPH:quinone reductase-like Zn-dependent oxidoreductase
VQKVGRSVSGLKVGDRVFVTGTFGNSGSYAQYVVSDDTYVFPLHERLSFAQVPYSGNVHFVYGSIALK